MNPNRTCTHPLFSRVWRHAQTWHAAVLTAVVASLLAPHATMAEDLASARVAPVAPSMSWYVHWADEAGAEKRARDTACRDASVAQSGVMFFGVGRQKDGGSTGFGKELLRTERIVKVASAYAEGLAECSKGRWVLALMTSNDKLGDDDTEMAGRFGTEWALTAKSVQANVDAARVEVRPGIDVEPGFGTYRPMKAWVANVVAEGSHIVFGPSADGCPMPENGEVVDAPCNNGWNTALMAELMWGMDRSAIVMPQVYKRGMALQWANIERVAVARGLRAEIESVLTQNKACRVTRQRPCLDLGPLRARKLAEEVFGREMRFGSDISW